MDRMEFSNLTGSLQDSIKKQIRLSRWLRQLRDMPGTGCLTTVGRHGVFVSEALGAY